MTSIPPALYSAAQKPKQQKKEEPKFGTRALTPLSRRFDSYLESQGYDPNQAAQILTDYVHGRLRPSDSARDLHHLDRQTIDFNSNSTVTSEDVFIDRRARQASTSTNPYAADSIFNPTSPELRLATFEDLADLGFHKSILREIPAPTAPKFPEWAKGNWDKSSSDLAQQTSQLSSDWIASTHPYKFEAVKEAVANADNPEHTLADLACTLADKNSDSGFSSVSPVLSPENLSSWGLGTPSEQELLRSPTLREIGAHEGKFLRAFNRSVNSDRNLAMEKFFEPNSPSGSKKTIRLYARSMGLGNPQLQFPDSKRSHSEALLLAAHKIGKLAVPLAEGKESIIDLKRLESQYISSTNSPCVNVPGQQNCRGLLPELTYGGQVPFFHFNDYEGSKTSGGFNSSLKTHDDLRGNISAYLHKGALQRIEKALKSGAFGEDNSVETLTRPRYESQEDSVIGEGEEHYLIDDRALRGRDLDQSSIPVIPLTFNTTSMSNGSRMVALDTSDPAIRDYLGAQASSSSVAGNTNQIDVLQNNAGNRVSYPWIITNLTNNASEYLTQEGHALWLALQNQSPGEEFRADDLGSTSQRPGTVLGHLLGKLKKIGCDDLQRGGKNGTWTWKLHSKAPQRTLPQSTSSSLNMPRSSVPIQQNPMSQEDSLVVLRNMREEELIRIRGYQGRNSQGQPMFAYYSPNGALVGRSSIPQAQGG